MFFSQHDAKKLFGYNKTYAGIYKDGMFQHNGQTLVRIPNIEEIFDNISIKIKSAGFLIHRVSPFKANCVVRVFRKECHIYKRTVYWTYGAKIYLRKHSNLYESYELKSEPIAYEPIAVSYILFQDEKIDIIPDFVDYYLWLETKA